MTITELKQLLERAEQMGYGSGKVIVTERIANLLTFTYADREIKGAHLVPLATDLLAEDPSPDYELRLDVDRGEE